MRRLARSITARVASAAARLPGAVAGPPGDGAAASVVTRSMPAGVVEAGDPARVVRAIT